MWCCCDAGGHSSVNVCFFGGADSNFFVSQASGTQKRKWKKVKVCNAITGTKWLVKSPKTKGVFWLHYPTVFLKKASPTLAASDLLNGTNLPLTDLCQWHSYAYTQFRWNRDEFNVTVYQGWVILNINSSGRWVNNSGQAQRLWYLDASLFSWLFSKTHSWYRCWYSCFWNTLSPVNTPTSSTVTVMAGIMFPKCPC